MNPPDDIFAAQQNAPQAISLLDFNRLVKGLLVNKSVMQRWVIAETSDVSVRRGGHCYLELLQKDDQGNTVAKASGMIWANVFASLSRKFLSATNQDFGNGMKVMLQVSASFHEQYGYKLVISDINPEFTLGDMARKRIEILNRLKAEGIIDQNKQVPMPLVPQRIAVISSATAAGYGDFMNQLAGNQYGVKFFPCLFAAMMQGQNTVPTVFQALERIEAHRELFDCVVIIRGGGSTTDLNWFDDYQLAARVAQFPLPVIVGIGHERDVTVLDYVACQRVKTPTAAAEFLIGRGAEALAHLGELKECIAKTVRDSLAMCQQQLTYYSGTIPMLARHLIETHKLRLKSYIDKIPLQVQGHLTAERALLQRHIDRIVATKQQIVQREQMRLHNLETSVNLLSPRNTLNRGYSLTRVLRDGKYSYVTDATQLAPGDVLVSNFKQGHARSIVKQ